MQKWVLIAFGALLGSCSQPAYEINDKVESVYPLNLVPPKDWRPNSSLPLDDALPRPWPAKYVNEYKQPFNPHAFFTNAAMLCSYYETTGDEDVLLLMRRLFSRFNEYVEKRGDAAFVVYRFERTFRKVTVKAPWTSGYASGAALIGLTILDECGGVEGARALASAVLKGMTKIADTSERPDLWVTFRDKEGYLWFEEMPLPQVEQPRILNGHIRALTGLYWHWAHTNSDAAFDLLQEGIRTVEHYVPQFRNSGSINHYDLWQKRPDYGPERTIDQQNILYKMTGDDIFATYRDMFESDMRDEIEAAKGQAS